MIQGFVAIKLKVSGCHHYLVNRYGISVSRMTTWYVLFVVITIWSFLDLWLITRFITIITRRSSIAEQVVFTLTDISCVNPWLKWGSCCSCRPIKCFHVLSSVLWCQLRFPGKNNVRFFFTTTCFLGVHVRFFFTTACFLGVHVCSLCYLYLFYYYMFFRGSCVFSMLFVFTTCFLGVHVCSLCYLYLLHVF